jgi:hypothetical protein
MGYSLRLGKPSGIASAVSKALVVFQKGSIDGMMSSILLEPSLGIQYGNHPILKSLEWKRGHGSVTSFQPDSKSPDRIAATLAPRASGDLSKNCNRSLRRGPGIVVFPGGL